jgi:hypothetical protein
VGVAAPYPVVRKLIVGIAGVAGGILAAAVVVVLLLIAAAWWEFDRHDSGKARSEVQHLYDAAGVEASVRSCSLEPIPRGDSTPPTYFRCTVDSGNCSRTFLFDVPNAAAHAYRLPYGARPVSEGVIEPACAAHSDAPFGG